MHWVRVVVLITVGLYGSYYIREYKLWVDLDLYPYQRLSELGWRALEPRYTALVFIDNEAFWRGELAGRNPVKRDYLARLISVLDDAGADVIALDIDLRSPDPNGRPFDHVDYARETAQLVDTIKAVAVRRRVVLSRALGTNTDHQYVAQANIYDEAGFCREDGNFGALGVYCGYIELPVDIRLVPPMLPLVGGGRMPSFALATIDAKKRKSPNEGVEPAEDRLWYGSYIPAVAFEQQTFLAREILNESPEVRRRELESKIVLVGGSWSQFAFERGPGFDLWPTPIGLIPGVLLHANYVEALLDGRIYTSLPEWEMLLIELALLLLCLLPFELQLSTMSKTISVFGVCTLLLSIDYVLFQNLGRTVDVFLPLVLLAAHAGFEQVSEWRALAHQRPEIREAI